MFILTTTSLYSEVMGYAAGMLTVMLILGFVVHFNAHMKGEKSPDWARGLIFIGGCGLVAIVIWLTFTW